MDDGLISQQQASSLLGVSRQRVNQLIVEGQLTTVTFAGRRLLIRGEVIALVNKRATLKQAAK